MAHVSYVERDQAAEAIQPVYDGIARKTGTVLNFLRTLAHSPDLFQGFLNLDGAMRKFQLDPQLRELAYMRASEVNGCEYCRHYHHAAGRKAGLSERQVHDLETADTSDSFDDQQRLVIRFAEQLTRQARVDDALVEQLKGFLSERELVELTATVALANYTNRVNNALKIDLP